MEVTGLGLQFARAGLTVGIAALLALIVHRALVTLERLSQRTATHLDNVIIAAIRSRAWLIILVAGLQFATLHFPALDPYRRYVQYAVVTAIALLVALILVAFVNGLFAAYRSRYETERAELTLVRRLLNVTVLVVAALVVLQTLGINITPVLASLGVAGLAVALALQDTLSNFFAGVHLALDRTIRVGDFIRLESGDEGFVEEIGWRSTRLRQFANNLVIVPNAKLASARVTNFFLPGQAMSIPVECGVGYSEDLARVEAVAVAVAREVMARVPGADAAWEPVVRWREFGDSNINFVTVLRVSEFQAQYALKSEFIKALHARFAAEGIEISWPVRKLVSDGLPVTLPDRLAPPGAPS